MTEAKRWHWIAATLGVVLMSVVGAMVFYSLGSVRLLPAFYDRYVEAALVAGVGLLAVYLLGVALRREARHRLGDERAYRVLDVYRLLAYVVVVLLVLAALGVNGTALLVGGTFAGLVLGLAAQTTLGNLIAGVMLLTARPFGQGDRITLATWQYSFLGPAYPPKFYSDDLLVQGFTGTVRSIGLAYTTVRRDDGTTIRFPNNIVIQAAVVSHEVSERWVRTKYEVPAQMDPKVLLPLVRERISGNKWVARPESVHVTLGAATLTSFVLVVDAVCKGSQEDPPRSEFLVELIDLVQGTRTRSLAPTS